jgi:hypothetical protein
MALSTSGGQATLPLQRLTTHDISAADYIAPASDEWPIGFIVDTTGAVSFLCVASGETVTRNFVGGVIHYVGAFSRVYHAATVATSITVGRP